MSSHGLIAPFFSVLNNIVWKHHCLFIHPFIQHLVSAASNGTHWDMVASNTGKNPCLQVVYVCSGRRSHQSNKQTPSSPPLSPPTCSFSIDLPPFNIFHTLLTYFISSLAPPTRL